MAGSSAGQEISREMNSSQGVELIIQRSNGKQQSIIQAFSEREQFAPGQAARLIQTPAGWHVSPI
jgi:outer membrane lipoprotein SlyB